jgi:hypothetical protein
MSNPEAQLSRLRKVTKILSLPPQAQVDYLKGLGVYPLTDELALQFSDSFAVVPLLRSHQMVSADAESALQQIDELLDSASESNPNFWSPAALNSSTQWQEIRTLATRALALLDPSTNHMS